MALITTTKGLIDESDLVKTTGVVDDDNEYTTWVEYRLKDSDEIIHRSAHITLKKSPAVGFGAVQSFQ